MKSMAVVLFFAATGPFVGGLAHLLLMAAFVPKAIDEEGFTLIPSLFGLAYLMGLGPALIVGAVVAWRAHRNAYVALGLPVAVALVVPIVGISIVHVVFSGISSQPFDISAAIPSRTELRDLATIAGFVTAYSLIAALVCTPVARRVGLLSRGTSDGSHAAAQ